MAITKLIADSITSGAIANTPNVSLLKNTDQSLSDAVVTKITFDVENFDSDSAWSSNTFTVPSGQDGKYFIQFGFQAYNSSETIRNANARIYKNGSLYDSTAGEITDGGNNMRHIFIQAIKVINLVATDTIEFYAGIDVGSGTPIASGDTYANIYKIIE